MSAKGRNYALPQPSFLSTYAQKNQFDRPNLLQLIEISFYAIKVFHPKYNIDHLPANKHLKKQFVDRLRKVHFVFGLEFNDSRNHHF